MKNKHMFFKMKLMEVNIRLKRLIFHVDVNSAYLSWEAAYRCYHLGATIDLRDGLYAVGGDTALILKNYTPLVEQYSIDEAFMDVSGIIFEQSPEALAFEIKERIKNELGFTVNVGIGDNKLLAKMAGDFEKPDKVHTLYQHEIKYKMWPLPVEKLFFVGGSMKKKLGQLGIRTIGALGQTDQEIFNEPFKKARHIASAICKWYR